jgi:3-hydroxy-9,10-secoandrosta-1,3,5(10)-triene-9,17-dione monooxygenase reductase component
MTANSFSSVSLDPMLVLWSIGKSSSSFNVFHNADKFAIHVLSADQREISQQFASKQADRFSGVESTTGYGGLPLLTDYAALFQCDVEHRYEGGDHLILVGRVADFDVKHSHPLIFHSGRYLAPEISIQH